MLNLNEFFGEVHDNSDRHGWWDEERSTGEILSLIHSELSEALEEYRAARPNIWYACEEAQTGEIHICDPKDENECLNFGRESECKYRGHKPEGIAVELADAVIRIFDFIGAIGGHLENVTTITELLADMPETRRADCEQKFPDFLCLLHYIVSEAYGADNAEKAGQILMTVAAMIIYWIVKQGIDAETLILEKHSYNKTRPYKHGNKVC